MKIHGSNIIINRSHIAIVFTDVFGLPVGREIRLDLYAASEDTPPTVIKSAIVTEHDEAWLDFSVTSELPVRFAGIDPDEAMSDGTEPGCLGCEPTDRSKADALLKLEGVISPADGNVLPVTRTLLHRRIR